MVGEKGRKSGGGGKRMEVPKSGALEVVLMRHGERVDRLFPSWYKRAFDNEDHYLPYDFNLPEHIPRREPRLFRNDCCLSEMGTGIGKLVGRAFRLSGLTFDAVYASPALRCVQTATAVLRMAAVSEGCHKNIRIEPGLFEGMGWYEIQPTFLLPMEHLRAGFPIDRTYKPLLSMEALYKLRGENNVAYHARSVGIIRSLVESHLDTERILIVAHAPTMDIGSRLLSGMETEGRNRDDLNAQGSFYAFSSVLALRRQPQDPPSTPYNLITDLIPPVSSTRNASNPDTTFLNR